MHFGPLDFLLDRRGCQTKDHWSLHGERVVRVEVVEEEVAHDQVVRVVLVCVMALVKHNEVDLLHMHEAVSEQIVKLVCDDDEDVLLRQFLPPLLRIAVEHILLLATVVFVDAQVGVDIDGFRLLVHQVLGRRNEHNLFLFFQLFFKSAKLFNGFELFFSFFTLKFLLIFGEWSHLEVFLGLRL